MADPKSPSLPPRWVVRAFWVVHRGICRLTPGRFGLWPAKPGKWGTMRLHTTGRRTGKSRAAILGYYEDGPNFITLAMNGWGAPEPAWWLNLQANPAASIELPGGDRRRVLARAAKAEERSRLWRELVDLGSSAYTDANAATRSRETTIVVLEPVPGG